MVWYSHLFKNFPQFVVIHTVKDFSVVSEAEVKFFEIPFLYMCVCVYKYLYEVEWRSLSHVWLCDPMDYTVHVNKQWNIT